GLFAFDGGSIGASNAVSISANAANNSYGAWSEGAGSVISLQVPVTITTSGGSSYGFYATDGGMITAGAVGTSDPASITTTGSGSIGVFASGVGSIITIDGPSIVTSGLDAPGLVASGGSIVLSGGSVTTNDDGSFGVAALGSGSSMSVTGTTITTLGNVDVSGVRPVDAWIVGAGATATLTNDTLVASGVQGHGVL